LLSASSCKQAPKQQTLQPTQANGTKLDSLFLQKKDSLYLDLIGKVNNDSIYIPVIRSIIDSLTVKNTHFGDTLFSDYFTNNYNFEQPLKYLKKIKINNYTLVIADFPYGETLDYYILNQNNKITDWIWFSSYHESVKSRKIYDWNGDGKNELVEVRDYGGQIFEVYTDVVYSIINDSLKLTFALTTRETNCTATGSSNIGSFVTRKYKYKGNGIYLISETGGDNDCNKSSFFAPIKTLTRKEYKMNINEILKEFGEQYMGNRRKD